MSNAAGWFLIGHQAPLQPLQNEDFNQSSKSLSRILNNFLQLPPEIAMSPSIPSGQTCNPIWSEGSMVGDKYTEMQT